MQKYLYIYSIPFILLLLVFQGCSVKKFIPEGELLYIGAEIEVESDTIVKDIKNLKSELEDVIRPEPNSKILGMRLGLYFHYKAQQEKPGFINRFFNKRMGEEPVYASSLQTTRSEDILTNRLENRGFFFSTIISDLEEDEDKKEAKAFYDVRLPDPYLLESYVLDNDSVPVTKAIDSMLADSRLKPGDRFDFYALQTERNRLDFELKKMGYYNFSSNFLIFEADTNRVDNKRVELFLRLKKDVPSESTVPYKLRNVTVYPNYSVGMDSIAQDTVRLRNKNFIQRELFFKPKRLEPFIVLEEGQFYNPETSRSTSRRLTSIGAYKFVNIRYDEVDSLATDSIRYLDANIFLSPLTKRALRAELQGVTKSNNLTGPNLAISLINRNLFKVGEILNITGKVGYEFQIAAGEQEGLNSLQLGLGTDLIFPRLLFPISIDKNRFAYAIPKTKVSLSTDYLRRSKLYSLGSISSTFGYIWQANRFVTHEFNPISLNYVNLANTTPEFEAILDQNPFLRNSFEQRFIAGFTYSFLYNGLVDQNQKHQLFFNSNLDVAGNLLSLLSQGGEEGEPKTFLGLEYAQYAKADMDIRYHLRTGSDQRLVTRLYAGWGIPYSNSEILPFSKQFFSGGPYSVRAFRIRSLGPGTFNSEESGGSSFFDQTGNLKLEANIEYRFPIISFLKGAVFADAGNIWNTTDVATIPDGKFTKDFMKELGIGVGLGLRIDIQSFVIRFDLAAPMHKPWLAEGERWVYEFEEPILNFAIGYPF